MGGCIFFVVVEGKTAQEAFRRAVDDAQHEYGHGGYTGSIAEKHNFKSIALPRDKVPMAYAGELIDAADPRVDDKYGPAGCIEMAAPAAGKPGKWLFFGWASS